MRKPQSNRLVNEALCTALYTLRSVPGCLILWYRRAVEARTLAEEPATPQVGGLAQAPIRQRMPLQQALALSLQQVRSLAVLLAHDLISDSPGVRVGCRRHYP